MYKDFEQLLQNKGMTAYKVSKDTGVSQTALSNWRLGKSVPTTNTLQKLADYFGVTIDYLLTGNKNEDISIACPDCGLTYDPSNAKDVEFHIEFHSAWEKANDKFGKLYCNSSENEKIKAINRNIRNDKSRPLEDRYNAELQILRCLFSDEVYKSEFDLNHIDFNEFVIEKLCDNNYHRRLKDEELYQKLTETYHICDNKLTNKDKRDISNDIESIMKKLSSKEYGPAAFDGEELSEESTLLFKEELEIALKRLKFINKEKYNPNKNKE